MAEWGKGDDRWIVQERQDGANVNQWHWSEKDCLGWSRERFGQLFADAKLLEGPETTARVTGVDSVEGEAFLNVRKKKLIPSYEICLTLSFTANVGGETVQGKVCTGCCHLGDGCAAVPANAIELRHCFAQFGPPQAEGAGREIVPQEFDHEHL